MCKICIFFFFQISLSSLSSLSSSLWTSMQNLRYLAWKMAKCVILCVSQCGFVQVLHESGRVCTKLYESMQICANLHNLVQVRTVCMNLRYIAHVCINLCEFAQVSSFLRESAQVCKSLWKSEPIQHSQFLPFQF